MPLTPHSTLTPRPSPGGPPWWWLNTRTVLVWLDVSAQTLTNWRVRDTGPPWRKDVRGLCWYRAADVAAWIAREPPGAAAARIVAFLQAHEKQAGHALWTLPAAKRDGGLRLLVRVGELDDARLERLCELVDEARAFGVPRHRPAKFMDPAEAAGLVGY